MSDAGRSAARAGQRPQRGRAVRVDDTEWVRYVEDDAFRKHIDLRVGVTLQFIERHGSPRLIGHVGSGVGLVGHLLASRALPYVGIDADGARVVFSRVATRQREYPGSLPRFEKQPNARRLPLPREAVDMLLLFDLTQSAADLGAIWSEAQRVVAPGGVMIIVEKRGRLTFDRLMSIACGPVGSLEDRPFDPLPDECWNDPARDMAIIARRTPIAIRRSPRRSLPTVRIETMQES